MSRFKFFSGDYNTLLQQGFANFGAQEPNTMTEAVYHQDLATDLSRMHYYSPQTVEHLQHLLKPVDPDGTFVFSYDQGQANGEVFTTSYTHTTSNYEEQIVLNPPPGFADHISLSYLNDENIPCGFSIAWLRDDRDKNIPVKDRPYLYTAAIIEGTHRAPDQRQVTWFAHPELNYTLPNQTSGFGNIPESDIPGLLSERLKSSFLSSFIPDLFHNGKLSVPFAETLKSRMVTGASIDNREFKWEKLRELCEFAENSEQLLETYYQFSCTKRDFYLDNSFEQTLEALYQKLKVSTVNPLQLKATYMAIRLELLAHKDLMRLTKHPDFIQKSVSDELIHGAQKLRKTRSQAEIDDIMSVASRLTAYAIETMKTEISTKVTSFQNETSARFNGMQLPYPKKPEIPAKLQKSVWKRNFYPLVLGALALALVIGVALTFTGVLAPIGLTITAGTAGLALTAAGFGIGVLLLAGLKMIYNEYKFMKAKRNYDADLATYRLNTCYAQEIELIDEFEQKQVSHLDATAQSFQQLKTVCEQPLPDSNRQLLIDEDDTLENPSAGGNFVFFSPVDQKASDTADVSDSPTLKQ